jgi:hypothetical protein
MGTLVTNHTTYQSIQHKRLTPTGRKGYYSIMVEGPNQYKLTISCVHCWVPHQPKPKQLSRVPPWQAIGGKTSIAGTPGRGLRQICIQELDGPRRRDLLDGINLHVRIMDLWGGWQRQALRTSSWGSRKLGRPHSFGEIDKRTHRKALTSRNVWINSGFADDRV